MFIVIQDVVVGAFAMSKIDMSSVYFSNFYVFEFRKGMQEPFTLDYLNKIIFSPTFITLV